MSSIARIALLALVVGLPGEALSRRPPPSPSVDLSHYRLVDLSHTFDERTLYWPSRPPGRFQLTTLHRGPTEGGFFYAANSFCAPEHGGTHLDAPFHFAEHGWKVAEIPVERLSGPAVVLDVTARVAADPDYRLGVADIQEWERAHGAIPPGAIVVLRTGWSSRWPDADRYLGEGAASGDALHLHFPSFGADAVGRLISKSHIVAIGVDTASIDHGPSRDFPVHRIVAAANVYGLENLDHLEQLPATGAWLVALPMKIDGGSGAPVRVLAFLPR